MARQTRTTKRALSHTTLRARRRDDGVYSPDLLTTLTNPNVIEMVKHLIVDALPARIEGRSDEELLQSEIDFVHKAHWGATANRDHAHHHPRL